MAVQKKESVFENMSEEYRKKHYPEGSVFKAFKKAQKGAGPFLSLFIMTVFTAGSLFASVWLVNRTLEIMRDQEEGVGIGIGLSVFFLLLAVVFVAVIVIVVKGMRKTEDDIIRDIAKACGLSEGEVREFDQQAMEPDSLTINHLGKMKSFTTGQKRGILTRDYICLYGNNLPQVLKLDRLEEAFIKDNSYSVKVGNTRKQAHYLTINLKSKDGKSAWAETSVEAARALQELLLSRCPEIDTADGAVLP